MKNCIVTPTYSGHFKFIPDYLKSFSRLTQDKNNLEICFTISKSEKDDFDKIIAPFKDLNIRVLLFEDILKKFGVPYSSEELLKKYERYSFQTLKKYYTMLYLGKNYRFLILDSESILLNKCNIKDLFDNFFERPFISYSDIKKKNKTSNLIQDVKANTAYALKSKKIQNLWFLENFVWFYDYKILTDMFKKYGSPFDIIDNVYKNAKGKREAHVFEIDLYQSFVYLNHKKYNYDVVDADDMLQKISKADKYKYYLLKEFKGSCGLLEHATLLLNKDNVKALANEFKNNRFNIIRCESTKISNLNLQKEFLKIVNPAILAASQNHSFGVKNRLIKYIRMAGYDKIEQHFIVLLKPIILLYKFCFPDKKDTNKQNQQKKKTFFELFIKTIGHFLQWLYQPIYLCFEIIMLPINLIIIMFLSLKF